MILTELEGKQLLQQAGLQIPQQVDPSRATQFPVMIKAQVLHGNRAQQDLIKSADSARELSKISQELLQQTDQFNQPITTLLVEQKLKYDREHYIALRYDTRSRRLMALYNVVGGIGMDKRGDSLQTLPLSVLQPPTTFPPAPALLPTLQQLWQAFTDNDATLIEINPLVKTNDGYVCLDAKVELEDQARFRHPEWQQYSSRSALGRKPTPREELAHQISRSDHRGVAGESFFEFPGGEIGIMASGGGASILTMDALLLAGLQPANYTEYSGNPEREKVANLAEVVLSIPDLKALLVVGSNANFTDIYETLAGVIDGLLKSQYAKVPGFILLIRRGGPRWKEAFEMVEERLANLDINYHLFGPEFPIIDTVKQLQLMMNQ